MGYRLEEDKTVTYKPEIIKSEKVLLCSTKPFDGCTVVTFFLTRPSHSQYDFNKQDDKWEKWPVAVYGVLSQHVFETQVLGASERFNTIYRTKTWKDAVQFHGSNHNNLKREFERQLGI